MKRDARLAILEAGADLVHRKGFNNTGIKEILDAAGVPKGSFYFYFPSKEAFGLALIEHFRDTRAARVGAVLGDASLTPLTRLRRFFEGARSKYVEWNCERGCPFGNLAQEMADLSPEMREALRAVLDAVSARIGAVLEEARQCGELAPGLDPQEAASFVMDAFEGALLRMKTQKDIEPLARLERMLFDHLLPAHTGEHRPD